MVYFQPFTVDYLHKLAELKMPQRQSAYRVVWGLTMRTTRKERSDTSPKHLYMAVNGIVLAKI